MDEDDIFFSALRCSETRRRRFSSSTSENSVGGEGMEMEVAMEVEVEVTEDGQTQFESFVEPDSCICLICGGGYTVSSGHGSKPGEDIDPLENEEWSESEKSNILIDFLKKLELYDGSTLKLFVEGENLSVCWSCLAMIQNVTEKKRETVEVEVVVRELQERLLQKLYLLDKVVGQFYCEMEKIAKILTSSSSTQTDADRSGGMYAVKRHILTVVDELYTYKNDLRKKLPGSNADTSMNVQGRLNDYGNDNNNCEEEMQYEIPGNFENNNDSVRESSDSDSNSGSDDEDFISADPEISRSPSPVEEHFEEESKPKLRRSRRIAFKKPVKVKRTRKKKNVSTGTSTGSKRTPSTPKVRLAEIEASHKIDFPTRCSFLKKHFILRAYQCELIERETVKVESSIEIIKTQPTMHPIKYNKETEKISVGDVELLIPENNCNRQLIHCSSCPFQAKATKANSEMSRALANKLEKEIILHVHLVHLRAFDCKLCPSKFENRRKYSKHMRRTHYKRENAIIVYCSICQKPLKRSEYLIVHEWTHKSEEEKAEAQRNGVGVPKRYRKEVIEKMTNERVHVQCTVCGKQIQKCSISKHMRLHDDNRPVVMCPVCGKTVLKGTYDVYHKVYVCPLPGTGMAQGMTEFGQQHRIQCIHCPTTFKAKRALQVHMKRFHSEEGLNRAFLCSVCGKGYKSQGDLQLHMRIHQKDRPWKCKFGCGKDFNVKRNCGRHEVTCSRKESKLFPEEI